MNIQTVSSYPKYKYFALILYCLMSFMNGMQWSTFMPITDFTCKILNISTLQVYFLGLSYYIGYPIVYFFANYALDVKGLRYGLNIGTSLTLVGCILRCFAFLGYAPLIIGQCCNSIGQPFILNAPSKLVNEWFEPKLRPFYITISASINLIGLAVGFLIPAAFINKNHLNLVSITNLLVTEAGMVATCCILQLVFFRNSPMRPEPSNNTKLWDCKPYKQLCSNKHYILFMLCSSLSIGNFQTISTVIEELMSPFGFTPDEFSEIGFVLLVGGFVEAIGLGAVINKTKKYKLVYMISLLLCQAIICLYYTILDYGKLWLVIIGTLLLSPGMVYITPLSMDYAPILSPTVGEAASCGAIMAMGQIASVVLISICNKIEDMYDGKTSSIFIIVLIGIVNIVEIILGALVKSEKIEMTAIKINNEKLEHKMQISEATPLQSPAHSERTSRDNTQLMSPSG